MTVLSFLMEIPIPGKTVFILRRNPGSLGKGVKSYFTAPPSSFLTFMFCDDWFQIFSAPAAIYFYAVSEKYTFASTIKTLLM